MTDSSASLLRQIAFGPVWLLTLLVRPLFRRDHPWHGRRLTLASWARVGTDDALLFSVMFWLHLFTLPALAWKLYLQ